VLGASMAGVSYGQTVTCTGARLNGITAVLRAEGQTEFVQDVLGTGCTSTLTTAGSITVTLSGSVETLNALIAITETVDDAGTTTYYLGAVSGTSVTFTNITFPTSFNFRVENIRVNASTLPVNTYVSEGAVVEYTSTSSVTGTAVQQLYTGLLVGYTQTSLGVAIAMPGGVAQINNYFTCIGDPLTISGLPAPSFTVNVTEITPGAFKQLYFATNGVQAGENGSSPLNSGAGVTASSPFGPVNVIPNANTPTEITVTLANIPTAATVYLPWQITEGPDGEPTTLQLVGFASPSATPPSIAGAGVVGFTPTATGGILATYAVVNNASWISSSLVFPIPIYVTFAPNVAGAQSAMTVAVAYAPALPTLGPAGPTTIPTFALGGPPLNVSIISFCQTTLLFPYVTNSTGYETGLAIANTSTDNLGPVTKTAPNGTSFGPSVSGTCTLNFYGNAAQPAAATFPKTGMLGVWNATSGQAPIYADTLTDLITITDFTGYAIANCNFLDAHGFAFIVDSTGSGSASGPEGYLAVVIPRNTTQSADANILALGDGN